MPLKQHSRTYDVVILGATGYTGRLTAEQLAASPAVDLKWALAGRSEAKLQAIAEECSRANPHMSKPKLETVDTNDEAQIEALARKAFVVITTVGPYCKYGEAVFRACARSGTHYLDCTGEMPWVARMTARYEAVARDSGAVVVPANGLEAAAADLITWAMARFLRAKLDAPTGDVVLSLHPSNQAGSLTPSGGTLATVLGIFDHFSLREMRAALEPYAQSPVPHPGRARQASSLAQRLLGVRHVPELGVQTTSLMASADVPVVERTWGLLSQIPGRGDQFYGPRFTFAEHYKPRNWLHGVAVHWALLLASLALGLVPPLRRLARRLVTQPGDGQGRDEMAKAEVEYRATAAPDTAAPSGKLAFCRARYRGSAYQLTALFLVQAAMTLLQDDVGLPGGVYTPACLGQAYLDRVNDAGFKIDVKLLQT
ncbi:hypothetical protein CDD83_7508 [Cordyceps sp. RAO-2017]|nr:hypothetical protein CDD83_7508 [Cordyceps sp. RAO-2017]